MRLRFIQGGDQIVGDPSDVPKPSGGQRFLQPRNGQDDLVDHFVVAMPDTAFAKFPRCAQTERLGVEPMPRPPSLRVFGVFNHRERLGLFEAQSSVDVKDEQPIFRKQASDLRDCRFHRIAARQVIEDVECRCYQVERAVEGQMRSIGGDGTAE